MSKKLMFILALAMTVIMSVSNLNTFADSTFSHPSLRVVTARSGLNVRDENCNVRDLAQYELKLTKVSDTVINCNINGQDYKMIEYSNIGLDAGTFVAEKYTKAVYGQNLSFVANETNTLTVNSPLGLNLRNRDCSIAKAVSYQTEVVLSTSASANVYDSGSYIVCKVAGDHYHMAMVTHNNQDYYAASLFLDQN
ncbi:MAG: hypothetical protein AAGF07_01000 [Patescibacteria group bacterium]